MKIEQYIGAFKKMYWQFTDDGFSDLLRNTNTLNTKVIASTSIFPELVKLEDDYHLIWDMKYWDLFDNYIRYVAFFLRDKLNDEAVKLCQHNIHKIIFEFLVCKMSKYPLISYCIARDILRGLPTYHRIEDGALCKKFTDKTPSGKLMQARMYVLLHETYHYEYKTYPKMYNEDVSTINQILNHIYDHKIHLSLTTLSGKEKQMYFDTIKSLLHGKNPTLLEEIACNYRAFIQLYDWIKRDFRYAEDKYILQDIIETIRISRQFQSELSQINNSWDVSVSAFDDLFRDLKVEKDISQIERYDEQFGYMCSLLTKKNLKQVSIRHENEILQKKQRSLLQNEIIYQVILVHSIKKYNILSEFEMNSKIKIDKYLLPVVESITDWELVVKTYMTAKILSLHTTFNPLQIIEARNMLMTWK